MPGDDRWNDFLALVDPARLAAAPLEVAATERDTTARFEAGFAAYCAENTRLMAATRRAVDDFRPAAADWRAVTDQMTRWLTHCAAYDGVAAQLQRAGRPALAARLAAVVADTTAARTICLDTAKAAAANHAAVTKTAADAGREATTTILDLNAATAKAFAATNTAWTKRH